MKVKVVEHSAKKYRADSKKGSPGWQQVFPRTRIHHVTTVDHLEKAFHICINAISPSSDQVLPLKFKAFLFSKIRSQCLTLMGSRREVSIPKLRDEASATSGLSSPPGINR